MATSTKDSNGWERWRGQVDTRLDAVTDTLTRIEETINGLAERFEKALALHESNDARQFSALDQRVDEIAALKTKIALISGGAGILAAAVADIVVRKLLGA